MNLVFEPVAPPLKKLNDGSIRVGNSRVTLETVICAYRQYKNAEEIVHSFPTLELADVHAVIAYALRHPSEIDAYMQDVDLEVERIRAEIESKFPSKALREKLLERLKDPLIRAKLSPETLAHFTAKFPAVAPG